VDGAKRYGVVIAKDGSVDQGATEKLREKMRGGRGDVGLFSFGGTIDEIKARSLDETHLPAPESPHA
ncbi:MAG: hydantoinase B/oxoprolinase family protein, partial [Woeseiaceae bacterium]|nr:hydantoinase B/oxoprolinase family protein [Woeseiaceae bacterium]